MLLALSLAAIPAFSANGHDGSHADTRNTDTNSAEISRTSALTQETCGLIRKALT